MERPPAQQFGLIEATDCCDEVIADANRIGRPLTVDSLEDSTGELGWTWRVEEAWAEARAAGELFEEGYYAGIEATAEEQ